MASETPLSRKMRNLAKSRRLDDAIRQELREKADAFDEATAGYYGSPQTVEARKFMGAYARARKLYCDISGEPLI